MVIMRIIPIIMNNMNVHCKFHKNLTLGETFRLNTQESFLFF